MPEFHHEYVKRILVASVDWPAGSRTVCADLLMQLQREGVLTPGDLQWGSLMLLGQLEDLTLDCPNSTGIAAKHFQNMLAAGLLSETFLRRCLTLRMGGGAGMVVVEIALASFGAFGGVLAGDGPDEVLDAGSFLKSNKTDSASPLESKGADAPGVFLCSTQRWILAVAYEVGMDPVMTKKVCLGTAEYLVDEGQ